MWSTAVFDPALPVRNIAAGISWVLSPHRERVEPEGLLERARRELLLAVRDHQGRVHVGDDDVAEVGAGDLRGRQAALTVVAVPRPDQVAGIDRALVRTLDSRVLWRLRWV